MPFFRKSSWSSKKSKSKSNSNDDETAMSLTKTSEEDGIGVTSNKSNGTSDKKRGSPHSPLLEDSNILKTQSSNVSLDTSTVTPRVNNIRPPTRNGVAMKRSEGSSSSKSSSMSSASSKFFSGNKSIITNVSSKSKDRAESTPPLSILTEDYKEELVNEKPEQQRSVDYDVSPTLLYKFIEYKDWSEAMQRCIDAPEEANTWVVRYESEDTDENSAYDDYEDKVVRWKMLPIHEAVIFNAPIKLLTMILNANPSGINSVDDRKMTPLHLCCRNLKNVNVAQFLILKDSETLYATDYKGRTPLSILKEYKDEQKDNESRKNYESILRMVRRKMNATDDLSESGEEESGAESGNEEQSTFDEEQSTFDKSTFDEELDNLVTTDTTGDTSTVYTDVLENKSTTDSAVSTRDKNNRSNAESRDDSKGQSQSTAYMLRNTSTESTSRKSVATKPVEGDGLSAVQRNRSTTSTLIKPPTPLPVTTEEESSEFNDNVIPSLDIVPKEKVKKNYIKRDVKTKKSKAKEADYDSKPTALIKLIERKMWGQAKVRCVENPEEAAIWMCRLQEVKDNKNKKSEVKWKILPIHSAIVLQAPVEMIEALVDAYPQGLRKGDDRDMLPLHMAFRLGASPETTAILVDSYPDALKKKDRKGHTPLHILKAYKRKYTKERAEKKSKRSKKDAPAESLMDKNRKKLIKFYLGGRTYGADDDVTLAAFDSEDEEEDYDSADDSTIIFDDEEYAYDELFYKNMFTDFGNLAKKGISHLPIMVRDTFSCRT